MDDKKPLIDFKCVYQNNGFYVFVDTLTDVCYIVAKNGGIQIMLTPEGKPRTLHYVENELNELRKKYNIQTNEELRKLYLSSVYGTSQTNIFSKGD